MNKLGNALYEIHHMDMLAAKDQWVNRLHPLVKLVLTIVFLTVTMSFPKVRSDRPAAHGNLSDCALYRRRNFVLRQHPAASDCSATCLFCGAVQSDL